VLDLSLHKHRVKEKYVQSLSRWIDSLLWFCSVVFCKYLYSVILVLIKYRGAQALQFMLKKRLSYITQRNMSNSFVGLEGLYPWGSSLTVHAKKKTILYNTKKYVK
jgi:hypothetical protein